MYQTPILFLIFNRPELTKQVFEKIREVQPSSLYVAADGPRPHKSEDIDLCAQARKIVQDGIDWPCEVKYLFREKNLGCGLAISGGISWFFEHVESGVILEDDCLPNSSFFHFCEEMLIKYSGVENVGAISGTNFFNSISSASSYAFSYYGGNWGWATWRRAWKYFDLNVLQKNNSHKNDLNFLEKNFRNKHQVLGLKNLFGSVISNQKLACSTWDFQWFFIRLKFELLTIVPAVNLITNIGLNAGTHFESDLDSQINTKFCVETKDLSLNLIHPTRIRVDYDLDDRFGVFYNWITISKEPCPTDDQHLYLKFQQAIEYIIYKYLIFKYKILSSKSVKQTGEAFCMQPLLVEGYGSLVFDTGVCIGTRYSPEYYSSYSYINIRNNGLVKLGEGVWTNNKLSIICNGGEICVGKNTLIGFNVSILNSDFHHLSYLRRKDNCENYENIYIRDNVFIGNNVQILKGVTIGENSIISAGSIVRNNIPKNSIFCEGKLIPIHVNI